MEMMKNDDGTWNMDQEALKVLASDFYKKLYKEDVVGHLNPFPLRNKFPLFTRETFSDIQRVASNEEVREAVFSMRAMKAAGLDGLNALFFQSQWDIVGEFVCRFVKDVFLDPEKINEVNDTIIVLIPKVESPESIRNFVPFHFVMSFIRL